MKKVPDTLIVLMLFVLWGCASQNLKIKDKIVFGAAEHVVILPEDVLLAARIDTGAQTSAISVSHIEPFEKDGQHWVRFTIGDLKTHKPIVLQRAVVKQIRIRRTHGEDEIRSVVKLTAKIGRLSLTREFGLADRRKFIHQVLIGRNYLHGQVVVDVSKNYRIGVQR